MSPPDQAGAGARSAPSMLDLVRLSPRLLFPPGGEALYRQIAVLTAMQPGLEVLAVGCGRAVTLEYFAREYGVQASGIEPDGALVESAVDRIRAAELGDRVQVQQAPADQLPYRDEIFDVVVGELEMTATADAADAVRELVRVTRPGGSVVLVQLVWLAPVEAPRRRLLGDHLGVRPRMLVEWRRLLLDAGVEDLHIEDWTDPDTAFRPNDVKPFPDFAELFSLSEKIGILRRAWRRWGWTGVRTVLTREREIHQLLTRDRVLGLDLIKGTKAAASDPGPASPSHERAEAQALVPEANLDAGDPRSVEAAPPTPPDDEPTSGEVADVPDDDRGDTRGLPLFSPEAT